MKRLANKEEARNIAERIRLPCGPLSYSQISTYMLCPRSYYFQYIMRIDRVGWIENLALGSVAHKGVEILNLQKQSKNQISVKLASRAAYTTLLGEIKKAGVGGAEKNYIEKQFKAIEKLIQLYESDFLPRINPTGIEHSIWVTLGGVPTVLKIDLIDDNKKVSDFKLTRKAKSERDAEGALQLGMYAAGMDLSRVSYISMVFPDLTKKRTWKPSIKESQAIKKSGDLSWTEDVVASFAKGIIRDSLEGKEEAFMLCDPAHWKCSPKMCDAWHFCRGKDKTVKNIRPPSWIDEGSLFTPWNDISTNVSTPQKEQIKTKETERPGWISDGFGTWTDL